jgi:hypothetical protein
MEVLHVYAQEQWHSEVHIVGTPAALRHLARTLEKAAREQVAVTSEPLFVNDGEGFEVRVVRLDDDKTADSLAVPYTRDFAEEKLDSAVWPWKLLNGRK